jgi:hypothetical protein
VGSGIVTISRSPSISIAADLTCIRFQLPTGNPDEPFKWPSNEIEAIVTFSYICTRNKIRVVPYKTTFSVTGQAICSQMSFLV